MPTYSEMTDDAILDSQGLAGVEFNPVHANTATIDGQVPQDHCVIGSGIDGMAVPLLDSARTPAVPTPSFTMLIALSMATGP